MSGLSARTSSWGGEGALLGLGGEAVVAGELPNFFDGFPLALRNIGASLSSSLGSAEDSDEESESSIVGFCGCAVDL